MKANLKFFSVLLLTMVVASSCRFMGNSIQPSKNLITRNYKVSDFTKIDAGAVGDIYYTQSTDGKTSVQISGPDNYVNMFEVAIKDSTLVINLPKNSNFGNTKNLKIAVSSPKLNAVYFKGVGNILIKDGLTTDRLVVNSKGVGNVKISSLTCQSLEVESTGVGDVELQGNAKDVVLESQGVGNIEAEELQAENVNATSRGVGNITCHATQSIDASVKGVGSIKYKGNPSNKTVSAKGIGSIKSIN